MREGGGEGPFSTYDDGANRTCEGALTLEALVRHQSTGTAPAGPGLPPWRVSFFSRSARITLSSRSYLTWWARGVGGWQRVAG